MNSSTKIANERKQDKRAHRSLNLAYIYLKNNELAEAERYARDYMSHGSDERGHKLLGDILRAQNKRDEALGAYENSFQMNPLQEDVLSLICDLIPPDAANCERLALWASRAAKSGFLEVSDRFRRSHDAAKSASLSDSKLNRVLKNIASNDPATPKQKTLNDSLFNHSQSSLDSVDFNFSGIRTKAQPSPLLQNRPQDGRMRNVPSHSENLMKSADFSSSKVLESNSLILKAIGENKLMILSFKKALDLVIKELREVKLSVKQVEQRQREGSETQKKLLDAFQTFQSLNDEEYGDGEEYGEYEDYGDGGYEQQTAMPYPQPLPTQTPLNVKTLPNFDHLQISPEKDVEVVFEKKPPSDLVKKAESLQLPSTFFSYMDKEDCPGCRGCEPSDDPNVRPSDKSVTSRPFVFGGIGSQQSPAPLFSAPVTSSPKTIFGQPILETPVMNASGFKLPAVSGTGLTFGGNVLLQAEKKSEPFSFGFKAPEAGGSLFPSSTDGKSGFSFGGSNQTAPWMTAAPVPIFGQKPVPTTNGNNDDNDGDDDDDGEDGADEYDPHYAPIIEMPNLVEVTTGEEDEETVYSQRAKLFRFDKSSKQWKERGIGDLKILRHRTKQRFRILMRREQVHKIACNHYLTKAMRLTPMNNSDNAVCWFATDFAEEEAAEEQFAAKFKNADVLKVFKDKFESLQQQLDDHNVSSDGAGAVVNESPKSVLSERSPVTCLPDLSSVSICSPSTKQPPASGTSVLAPAAFSFSTPKSDAETATSAAAPKSVFGSLSLSDKTSGPFVFGGFGNQSSASVFGTPAATSSNAENIFKAHASNEKSAASQETATQSAFQPPVSSNNGTPVSFGGNILSNKGNDADASPVSFGFKVPENSGSGFFGAATDSKTTTGFAWGNDSGTASWMATSATPIFGQKPVQNGKSDENDGDDDGGDDEGGEEEYDPQYAPIIELPNLVEVTTGEEDEETVYSQRAKLFRFDKPTKQWKERGVGDLKILKHRTMSRFRIVMRREQVHKIACNHYLTKVMKLTPMNNSDTAVCWFATDYAEEEVAEEQFAAKFKNADILKEFREKFESLQQQLP